MKEYNDGIGESNVMQNKFTAYLVTAVHRKRVQYLQAKYLRLNREISMEINELQKEIHSEIYLETNLPILDMLESGELRQALEKLNEHELRILVLKVLDECSFKEIAVETGIGYKTVASIYYRLIHRLRNELGGEKD